MMHRKFLIIAACSGFIAVMLGAFGAHGLKSVLDSAAMGTYKTAVQYQLAHTLALLAVGLWLHTTESLAQSLRIAGWCFTGGILLFSGSLYALAMGAPKALGPITPVGGLLFMAGWFNLLIAAWRLPAQKQ